MPIIATDPKRSGRWGRATRALKHPRYRRYFFAQIPLVLGTWIHSIALGWLVWRFSHSPWLLGVLALCDLGPTFILGPLTGAIVDRLDRRKTLIMTQGAFLAVVGVLAVLTLLDQLTLHLMLGLTLALGVVSALDSPARQAFVAELVPTEDLTNAIVLNSMLFNSARLIGPAVGGGIVAFFGEGWCFLLKALAHMPMLGILACFQSTPTAPRERIGFAQALAEGLAFVRGRGDILRILVLVGICSFTSVPYFSFLPALASEMLASDAKVAGMLMSLTGMGAMLAAVVLTLDDRPAMLRKWPSLGAFLLGLTLIGIGASKSLWLTSILAVPLGVAALAQNLSSNTFLQHATPSHLRGRVMALYSMMLLGTMPLGSIAAGAIGAWLGMPAAFIAGGIVCALAGILLGGKPGPD